MRSFVPAIYDCTVAVPRNQDPPTMLRIFRAQSSVVGKQNTLTALFTILIFINGIASN
jgi:hypothetical protein